MHSSTLACAGATFVNDPTTCTDSEYGNRMTPMGSGCGMLNGHDLWYQQLIGGCNGVKVTTSGTFNLFPLETACNATQVIQIPMITTGRMVKPQQGSNQPLKNYYLEYRTKTGLDASLTQAVYVYAGDNIKAPTATSNWSWLLDMNPSTTTFDGLAAGGSFTDPNGDIKVTVMSEDATKAVVQIDVQGGAGAAATCIDGTTMAAPGAADCGSGPATGTGGTTGTGGAGGTTGAGGRGGTTGSAGTGGRGGTTGSAARAGAAARPAPRARRAPRAARRARAGRQAALARPARRATAWSSAPPERPAQAPARRAARGRRPARRGGPSDGRCRIAAQRRGRTRRNTRRGDRRLRLRARRG